MTPYIEQWFHVLNDMKNTNTYKMVWGKAILDLVHHHEGEGPYVFTFGQIAEIILKYYWNQIHFFKLKQGPINQQPTLERIVQEALEKYETIVESTKPVWFNFAQTELKKDMQSYNLLIKRIAQTLHLDVSKRFHLTSSSQDALYTIQKSADPTQSKIIFSSTQFKELKESGLLLTQMLYFKWTQLLERYNRSPKIANKIAGSALQEIQRNSLKAYKDVLLKLYQNGAVLDFYTDEPLDSLNISVDHFIPWSYMYSDDLWNLVITSKSNNSKKSNKKAEKIYLQKLKEQNQKLIQIIKEDKYIRILEDALKHQYLERFFSDFIN
jgi:heterodisulfide reductase subunit C